MSITTTYRDFRRIREIVSVLLKYELGWIVDELKLYSPLGTKTKSDSTSKPQNLPERLRLSMEELGGAYIKLGQLLSIRPDLVPREYSEELSKLQDNVLALPFEEMKVIIEEDLKRPVHKIFDFIDEKPIASASVAQVYKARLVTGELVAVKIQRPNLDQIFEADIDLLHHLAELIQNHSEFGKQINPIAIVDEFKRYTANELNFLVEAKNAQRFGEYYNGDKHVKIPRIYPEYCSKRVLVLEFINGISLHEVKNFNEWRSSRQLILRNVVGSMTYQVAELGFFHADPHPGNIFVIGDNRIAYLDFGIVGELKDDEKKSVQKLFIALVNADRKLLAASLEDLGFVGQNVDLELFHQDLSFRLGKYHNVSLQQMPISDVMYDLLELARKYKMTLPPSFVLLVKAVITIEGMGKEIDPTFNFVKESKPFVEKLMMRRIKSRKMLKNVQQRFMEVTEALVDLPQDMKKTLDQIRNRGVNIRIDDTEVEELGVEIDRSASRITFSILIAAFVVGAALVILAKLPPLYQNIPILAIVLLIMAIITLFILMISIAREKKR